MATMFRIRLFDLPIGGTCEFRWGDFSPPEVVDIMADSTTAGPHDYQVPTTYVIDVIARNPDGSLYGQGRTVIVFPWVRPPLAQWGDPGVTWGDIDWQWDGSAAVPSPWADLRPASTPSAGAVQLG